MTKERPAGDFNVFEAEIAEEIFKGATDQLELVTKDGLALTAVAANEGAHEENCAKGDAVFCSLHASDIVVVQEE